MGIFLKVCDAIAFAHFRGVIHRDLKPDNIMVGDFGEVLVMDWGLAKVASPGRAGSQPASSPGRAGSQPSSSQAESKPAGSRRAQENAVREADTVPGSSSEHPAPGIQDRVSSIRADTDIAATMEGAVQGTPAYMPPEQAEGDLKKIDHRSDIYSLGAILYEILTLKRPVEGKTVHDVLLKVSDGKILSPEKRTPKRNIPKELSAVVMKAMSRNRRRRYQSVGELQEDINLFLEGRGVSAKEDTFIESVSKLIRRNKGISLAVSVAASVIAAVILVAFLNVRSALNLALDEKEKTKNALILAEGARQQRDAKAEQAARKLAGQAIRAAEIGFFKEANVQANAALEVAPDLPWGPYAMGTIAWEKKDLDGAKGWLGKALKADPKHEPSVNAMARLRAIRGDAQQAAAMLKDLDKNNDWRSLASAGDVFHRIREFDKAAKLFRRALKLQSADEVAADVRIKLEDKLRDSEVWIKCRDFDVSKMSYWEQAIALKKKLQEIHSDTAKFGTGHNDNSLLSAQLRAGSRYLQPLRGTKIARLEINSLDIQDYSPLKGLGIRELILNSSAIKSLDDFRGMPLRKLVIGYNPNINDLSPIEDMPLEVVWLGSVKQLSDLTPLAGKPLKEVILRHLPIRTLEVLSGAPIEKLILDNIRVTDLSPLKGAPLRTLEIHTSPVTDLSPLKGMKLTKISFNRMPITDISPLADAPLFSVDLLDTGVADLTPLRGAQLKYLRLPRTKYLSPESIAMAKELEKTCEVIWSE